MLTRAIEKAVPVPDISSHGGCDQQGGGQAFREWGSIATTSVDVGYPSHKQKRPKAGGQENNGGQEN